MNIAIIFAGGTGQRLSNTDNIPKQFLNINSKPVIIHTLEIFQQNENIDKIYIAIHPDWYDYMQELIKRHYITKTAGIVKGGKTGQDSIYNALCLAEQENDGDSIVLIHDGVRPYITQEVINENIKTAQTLGNAITCTPCSETVLISKNGKNPETVPYRKETFVAQAPQTFRLKQIINEHRQERLVNPNYENIIDSCTLLTKHGITTNMIKGNWGNIKITTLEDLYILRALIRYNEDIEIFNTEKKDLTNAKYC